MRLLSLALSFLLALSSAASAADEIKNPDTFVYAAVAGPVSLDPAWAYDAASQNVIANVYEFLLAYKGAGLSERDLAPMLSAKVPSKANGLISPDGRTYRFPIREGVKFHDGTTMTPEDARYSLLRFLLTDRDGGPSSLLLEPILGVGSTRRGGILDDALVKLAFERVTVERGQLVIRLARPFAPLPSILANFGAIMSRDWCARHGQWDGTETAVARFNNPARQAMLPDDEADGTGPFKLERFDLANTQVVLVRHDGYWRKPARLRRVVIKTVEDFNTRKLMLQAGDADAIYAPQMYFPQLKDLPGVESIDGLESLERSAILMFTFNIDPTANPNIGSGRLDGEGVPPDFFSDKDVREAFAYSVDYDAYVRDLLRGKGSRTTGVIPKGLPGGTQPKTRFTLDPKKAEERFRKAWGGKVWERGFRLSFVFLAGAAPSQVIAQMVKKNVEALNPRFRVDLRMMQWSTYLEQTQAKKLPLFLAAWQADYPDAHSFASAIAHSAGFYAAKQGYKNAEVDALIDEAAKTLDEPRRVELYRRMQGLVDADAPHVMLADGARYRTQRAWVKGFVYRPTFPDMPYGSYYYDLSKSAR